MCMLHAAESAETHEKSPTNALQKRDTLSAVKVSLCVQHTGPTLVILCHLVAVTACHKPHVAILQVEV
jgi:hypothetical protein